jgi:predicted ribosome quality control (RQC) complex YloA/Tae2 family protein
MLTDWLLIRRAAAELQAGFAGARARDVGRLPDGRTAIALWSRGAEQLLCIDAFGSPPLVTLEPGELPIAAEPGFVRALGAAIRGMNFLGAKARRGDRLLRLEFGSRSRFGVVDGYALILELVPRFGNAVLCKGETVVAALREFSLAENGTRAVLAGQAYQPPPLRDANAVPRAIAENYSPEEATEIIARFGAETMPMDDLFVYRRDGAIVQAHLVALPSLSSDAMTREPSLLACFAEARVGATAAQAQKGDQRRAMLLKKLRDRERKTSGELEGIAKKRERAADRDGLRDEGEAIFATLHDLADDAAREEAKGRATALFAQYRKLGASLPHLDERERHLREQLDAIQTLQWETERASEADLADAIEASRGLDTRPQSKAAPREKKRRRAPLEFHLPSGSRIVVGRTPIENADVTFRIGRPDDLWFHVQNQPSAHVILQRDDREAFTAADIEAAAALAAYHSKAKTSPKVTVDYTRRKHVRKRPAAAPGLVFYTNPKSISVTPSDRV